MNTYLKMTIVLLISFIVYGGYDSTCLAAEKESIDVVLVMDSSGSMKKTDPHSLRIPAAKLFLSLLDSSDRAGVISFSDRGYPIAHLTPVDNDQNKDNLFRAIERISSKGLFTNLYDAFNTGLELLLEEKVDGRQRIIILMSDGMMDVGDPREDKALVDKLQNELGEKLKQEGVRVYTIAFTEQSDRRLLEKISKRTGGFYNLALTDKDFHVIFTSIFEGLKEPEMLPMEENGFLIDGSIQEVTIVATKTSPAIEIQINAPDGQKYVARNRYSGLEWFVSDNFDMITVQKPVAGRWEILFSTGENNKAYIITDLKLETNFEQLYAVFGENLDIQAWLAKEGTVINAGEVLETTAVSMELKNPDGNFTNLEPFNKGDGIFRRSISPFTPGNYRFTVVAKGKTFGREKSFLFNVASLDESKEDIETRRAEMKAEKEQVQPPENELKEGIAWTKIAIQFVAVNIFLAIVILLYLKFGRQIKTKLKTLGKRDHEGSSGDKNDPEEDREEPDQDNDNQEVVTARDDLNGDDDDNNDSAEEKEEKEHITLEDEDSKEHHKADFTEESAEKGHIEQEVDAEQEKGDDKSQISQEELDQKQPESVETEEIPDEEADEVIKETGTTQVSRSEVEDIDKLLEGALEEQEKQEEPVKTQTEDTDSEKSHTVDFAIPENISTETEDKAVETETATEKKADDTLNEQTKAAVDVSDSEENKDDQRNDTEDTDTLRAETPEGQQEEANPDYEQSDDMDDAWDDALKEQDSAQEQDKPDQIKTSIQEKVAEKPQKTSMAEKQDSDSGDTSLSAESDQDDMAQAWEEALDEQKENEGEDTQENQQDEHSINNDELLDLGLPERISPEPGNVKMDKGTGDTTGA